MSVNVLFIEDQAVVQDGLAALLEGTEIRIVETANTCGDGLPKAAQTKADVVVLDVRMTDGDGLNMLARLKTERPNLPVVVFSAYENPSYVARAVALGASAYVTKGQPRAEVVAAIKSAADGKSSWNRDELRRVSTSLSSPQSSLDGEIPLTRRETEVLRHIVQGHTNKQIAEHLKISYETVKEHVQHMLKKIGVTDRTQAAVWAVRNGLSE